MIPAEIPTCVAMLEAAYVTLESACSDAGAVVGASVGWHDGRLLTSFATGFLVG